jgi:hypothetical protein
LNDYLDLPGWKTLGKRTKDGEEVVEAEYTVKPEACQRCSFIGRLYRHGRRLGSRFGEGARQAPA